jgi:hypothetical protein
MDTWLTFDLFIGGVLIAGLAIAAFRMPSARVIAGQDGSPATSGRARLSLDRAVTIVLPLGSVLALLAFFTVTYVRSANQVIGSPTRAQVTGHWIGDYALNLVLRPDGTFTTGGLPPRVGTAAPVTNSEGVLGAWSGHGTWVIGPGAFDGSPQSVIFTVACDAAPSGCAGHPRTFDLELETNAPDGGSGPALFYYLSSRHDLTSQYSFNREP